ncbi:hypothetical protein NUU61_009463 [Penicillium alfredii]|uniref:Uncharacterized protein n=1 Tax=Penicillium alfredii TaxID=1506179 RepID=A0A9W9JWX3_9EURO|nr:uncharacterized protein NUU61_009463 [Penicillium alfredii]KAJ5084884.1 hypothetical protein NUU61_009463 [Penicillium alfredii]
MHCIPLLASASLATAGLLSSTTKRDTWGGRVSLGPTKSTTINAVSTLIPGTAPSTQNGVDSVLSLWPGMSNGTGDLIQTTLESWTDNSSCGATTSQCAVAGSDQVRIEYNVESNGETWKQTVINAQTGDLLSTYSLVSGPYMTGHGTGTECNDDCTGTVAAQEYRNTKITLASADTAFGDTIASATGASCKGLGSSEGGKVWTIQRINIPAMS